MTSYIQLPFPNLPTYLFSLGEFLSLVNDDSETAGEQQASVDPSNHVHPTQGIIVVAVVGTEKKWGWGGD